jgi:hypothetical protein
LLWLLDRRRLLSCANLHQSQLPALFNPLYDQLPLLNTAHGRLTPAQEIKKSLKLQQKR